MTVASYAWVKEITAAWERRRLFLFVFRRDSVNKIGERDENGKKADQLLERYVHTHHLPP